MDKSLEKLRHSLLHNNPNLFLGAGFSLGSRQKNGQPAPSGRILKENMIIDLLEHPNGSSEYEELKQMPLYKLCSYIKVEKGEDAVCNYLCDIFTGLEPEKFHNSYISYPWNNIFSTNIDDLIETLCSRNGKALIVRNTRNNTRSRKDNELDLYKLHGCVNNINGGLIFDEEEYLATVVDRSDFRFGKLAIELQDKDFVFVGSDFDDFNIKYYLNIYSIDSSVSNRGNLFFINPYPSMSFKNNIKSIGGFLIEYTAEQFAKFLDSIEVNRESIDETKLLYEGYIKVKHRKKNATEKGKYDSDLYVGATPKWEDIFYDWDIILPKVTSDFKEKLDDFSVDNRKSLVYAIFGKGYSGKSVILKRLSQILIDENYEVISFEGQDFSPYKMIKYIKSTNYEKYALAIDNASYIYGDFEYLCKNIPDNIKLCIISTSREFFHSRRRYGLVDLNCVEYELHSPVNDSLAENIIDKLSNKGYTGSIMKDCPTREAQLTFARSYPDIGASIFAITHGRTFKTRFTKDVTEILKNGHHRNILINLAIFQRLQLPYFPLSLFTNLYKKQTSSFLKRIEDITRRSDQARIELKNEFIGDVIIRNATSSEILEGLKQILIGISSMVGNSSNSYWNELHSALIREKDVTCSFKIKSRDFKNMLYKLRPYYSENYNYWLQLGIAEQIDNDLDKALIHFNLAQKYGPNSYMVKNAIGRNFILQSLKEIDDTVSRQLFSEGKNILFELIQDREEYQVRAYSTHTYLSGLMQFYKIKRKLKISREEIREGQNLIDGMLKRYKDDPKFMSLGTAWTKFVLQHSSTGIKMNLSELQDRYNMSKVADVDFEDFE